MSDKCYRSELIGLFGDPVDENPTVVIMEAAFKELGLNYRYITTHVIPEDLEIAVKALKAFHMKGANITIPHKVEVLKYLDVIAPDAKLIGAVNTIYLKNGKTYGENTDGKGFILSLQEENIELQGKKVVILGAGGAARSITIELALKGVKTMTIVNRDKKRGETLVDLLNAKTNAKAGFVCWDETYNIDSDVDIVVNATSIGLYPDKNKPNINYDTLTTSMIVCDVIPNPLETLFLKEAKKKGCQIFDGFSMLVKQGAISFEFWTDEKAPIEAMKAALGKEMSR